MIKCTITPVCLSYANKSMSDAVVVHLLSDQAIIRDVAHDISVRFAYFPFSAEEDPSLLCVAGPLAGTYPYISSPTKFFP